MFKILGFSFYWTYKINFFYHDWHLAGTSKFMKANCTKTIAIPFLMIYIWGYNAQWAKQLGLD